jgi:hypothetical protein
MPVIAATLQHAHSCMMKAHFILPRTPMPHRKRTLAASLQILPQRGLMLARQPAAMRHGVFSHGTGPAGSSAGKYKERQYGW